MDSLCYLPEPLLVPRVVRRTNAECLIGKGAIRMLALLPVAHAARLPAVRARLIPSAQAMGGNFHGADTAQRQPRALPPRQANQVAALPINHDLRFCYFVVAAGVR